MKIVHRPSHPVLFWLAHHAHRIQIMVREALVSQLLGSPLAFVGKRLRSGATQFSGCEQPSTK